MSIRKRSGFSLVEMLVVIGIIALLAAIMFPVFATAKRQAKKNQCIGNMNHIFTALKMFETEEHRFPEFLAGPVQYESDMKTVVSIADSDGMLNYSPTWKGHAFSLYPEYLKSVNDLRCPLAPQGVSKTAVVSDPLLPQLAAMTWNDTDEKYPNKPVRLIGWDATENGTKFAFDLYKFSSYDWQVPPGCADTTAGETHYSNVWNNEFMTETDVSADRQLKWRNPPADTVVTWCSYHREMQDGSPSGGSKDLVLFADGHVQQVPSHYFFGTDVHWYDAWKNVSPDSK